MTLLLQLIILVPVFGLFFINFFVHSEFWCWLLGLVISYSIVLLSIFIWLFFDYSTPFFQGGFSVNFGWTSFMLGVDGLSVFFLLLTGFLIFLCLLMGWNRVVSGKFFVLTFLVLEVFCLLSFLTSDILFFYVMFEAIAIPMFIIIGYWGSRQRKIRASYQFFLYTIGGSLFMLLGILLCLFECGSSDIFLCSKFDINVRRQILLFLCFFLSFAVKVPMIPVHIWLPEAHVEAPTTGSVLLAGLLLKLGGYGFIRFLFPLLPYANVFFSPAVFTMSVLGIIYASLTTIRQVDLKKIIAYSSIAHMNLVNVGLFSLNIQGLEGGVYLMLSHGLVSSALFFCVGMLYDRFHTRVIKYYQGLAQLLPQFSFFFFFFSLANMGLPGTSSFVGEFLVLVGIFQANTFCLFLSATSCVLGAVYCVWLANRLLFGNFSVSFLPTFFYSSFDLDRREFFVLFPLTVFTLFFGIRADLILDVLHSSLSYVLCAYL